MQYEYIDNYCSVFVDRSSANGLLRFSHEVSVVFVRKNNEWEFDSAWHIGISEASWEADEEWLFEKAFPGLLDEMRKGLKN